ncbi:hypothetical protein A2686_00795 [Candidatus Woesebacteria bacterium RIFCSPHIGHO2_01_FULL_38_10]|nr:MAG: hypothetical protein A2686_00795 [Candidatus Woesebacteria bacterium RIFCSPHIGHO2_01_FULL_38_10]
MKKKDEPHRNNLRNYLENWRNTFFILVGIIFIGFFLRIFRLTFLPVFGDEAIYIRWAQVMRAEPTLRFLPLSDGKQPLFMWMVIPFLKIISNPLFAGRLVSLLTGLGTLTGTFILTYLLFENKKQALISSFLYAISPFSLFFDRLALVDSMLSFFGIWALIFAIITVKKIRLDSAMLAGFSLGGALLTKSPAIFFTALMPSILVFHNWPKRWKERFNRLSILIFLFTFTYLIALGMYNILKLGPNFHMIALRNKDYVYPLSHLFKTPFDPFIPFLDRTLEYFWLLGPAVLVLLILIGIFNGFRKRKKETFILLAWGFIPILAVAEFSKTMTARYVFFTIPYLFVLASLSLSVNLFHLPGGRSESGMDLQLRVLLKLALVIFVIHSLFLDIQLLIRPEAVNLPRSERSGYLEEWTSGTGIKEVADLIRDEYAREPEKKIVVGTEGYFGTLPDGLQIYLNDLPEITVIGTGLDFKKIPKSLIESKRLGNKTYFVVNSSRLRTDSEKLGLKTVSVYPKAIRPDGERETLYFFEIVDKSLELN